MWPPQSCPGHTDGRAGLPSPWQSPWQSGRCRWATHCSTTIWDRSKLSQFPGFVYNLKETNPILTLCPLYPACWRQDWHTSGLYPAHSNDSINKSEGKYQWENVSVNIFHLFLGQHPMMALLNLYNLDILHFISILYSWWTRRWRTPSSASVNLARMWGGVVAWGVEEDITLAPYWK